MTQQVTIRLTGIEQTLKTTIKELERTFGHRLHLNMPRILYDDEWICSGTIDLEQPPENREPGEIVTLSDEPLFTRNEQVRVLSTGSVGTVVDIQPTRLLARQDRYQWRYIVVFPDGGKRGYLADALDRLVSQDEYH